MSCEDAKRGLSLILDGEEAEADEAALFAHLGACAECRSFLDDARRLRRALQADRDALADSADRALPAAAPRRRPWRDRAPRVAAAAIAACLLLTAGILVGARWGARANGPGASRPDGGASATGAAPGEPAYVYVCTMPEYPVFARASTPAASKP